METFDALLAAETEVITSGGENLEKLDALITENLSEYREHVLQESGKGYSAHGSLSVSNPKLQQHSLNTITFYGCLDLDKGYLTDKEGNIVGGDRAGKIGSVEITVIKDEAGAWRVDRNAQWSDPQHCSSLR